MLSLFTVCFFTFFSTFFLLVSLTCFRYARASWRGTDSSYTLAAYLDELRISSRNKEGVQPLVRHQGYFIRKWEGRDIEC